MLSPTSPHIRQLPDSITPEFAFGMLRRLPGCCWLDSALTGGTRGRYSFLAADPCDWFCLEKPVADPMRRIEEWRTSYRSVALEDLPPFQGGIAGFLAYEFGRCFERVPAAEHDEFSTPIAALGLYDVVLAWDHEQERGWLISQGFPEQSSESRRAERAKQRGDYFWEMVTCQDPLKTSDALVQADDSVSSPSIPYQAMAHGLTAPQYETRLGREWLGNFDSPRYRAAVEQARQYIFAGDIFQVNLSQRLLCPSRCDSATLYQRLRQVNSAPFAGYFDFGAGQIVSASPERFVQVDRERIETRPIKGTRKRTGDRESDAIVAEELRTSAKDRSENTMIVDLLRNDLSRICEIDSIKVEQFCEVEVYPFVLHLVSSIAGRLRPEASLSDLFSAIFPGGSITGAPKIRAMEIIAELEPTARGPYCGSLGYCSSSGAMDWNILIRTLTASQGWWQIQVGGAIVADSDPEQEEEETWTKAAGMVAAIESVV